MDRWQLSFRVGEGQDKDDRYDEVLAGKTIPPNCVEDVQAAHDEVWEVLDVNEPTKPYAVYMSGTRDGEEVTINTRIEENA